LQPKDTRVTLTDIELILFDIDGTLLSMRGSGREATRRAMLEVFATEAGIQSHVFGGKTDWRTLNELLTVEGFTEAHIEASLPAFEAAMATHLYAVLADYPVEVYPGALEAVQTLHERRFPLLGVLTGNVSTTAPIKLRAAGFDPDWFPITAFGNESPDRNALPFLALARAEHHLQRRIRPDQVLVVGDTVADIDCARALGANVVAVKTGHATNLDGLIAAQPDYLLDDLSTFFQHVYPLR
jgi:phosphoglycolate phosphatase